MDEEAINPRLSLQPFDDIIVLDAKFFKDDGTADSRANENLCENLNDNLSGLEGLCRL